MSEARTLDGARILLVEDEFLLAILLEDDLTAAGARVVGPFHRLAPALAAARSEALDAAILDINLGGEFSYPVAEALDVRGVPVLFLSGYAARDMPERFRGHSRIGKPYEPGMLMRRLEALLAGAGGRVGS